MRFENNFLKVTITRDRLFIALKEQAELAGLWIHGFFTMLVNR
ncbi:MAG: hypothetical protein WAZ77_03710 [Candidatus Nitrosopolaris sp.]